MESPAGMLADFPGGYMLILVQTLWIQISELWLFWRQDGALSSRGSVMSRVDSLVKSTVLFLVIIPPEIGSTRPGLQVKL